MRKILMLALCGASFLAAPACKKKKSGGSAASEVDPNFEKPVTASSVLELGSAQLAGTKIVSQNDVSATSDPALAVFAAELHPKLKQYCAAGCHDMNQRPFASDAISLAYEMAKPFMADNPDDSQMIKNIRASHNGTNPAWAAEVGAAIQKVAAAIP